jgi:osmoprotectant transport system ATP-binding protein
MSEPILKYRNVSYNAGGRTILDRITLDVLRGETVALLGRSGSGKTTLLRLANRLIEPASGEVFYEGRSTAEWDAVQLRRSIGYAIQDVGLFPHLTVEQNIGLVPKLEGWPADRIHQRVTELLALMGLDGNGLAQRRPRQLSGGQRQRVGLARALAADPHLLLLDEPFAALDPVTRLELQRHFVSVRQRLGTTALFVTHDLREAFVVATRVVLLRDGGIVFDGPPEGLLQGTDSEARVFADTLNPHA